VTIGLLIVEDDARMRRRLADAIEREPDLKLLGVARGYAEGLAKIQSARPDVALIDLGLPDGSGVDLVRYCRRHLPECEVLVLSVFTDEASVNASIEAGAHGYLLKDLPDDELVTHVRALRQGGSPVSPVIARQLLRRFHADASSTAGGATPSEPAPEHLTPREISVLTLLSRGYSYAEIASKLFISTNTVASHIKQIYRKLDVNSRGEAVFKATRDGQLDPPGRR
jgi:DNA-binding NarL/FixJ family response regulator